MPVTRSLLTRPAAPRRTACRGTTLVELLVALALLGVVGGALLGVLLHQQGFARAALDGADVRSQLRDASAIVPALVRGVSPRAGDVLAAGDSGLIVLAPTGSAVVCGAREGSPELTVPAPRAEDGHAYASWVSPPVPGDSVLVLREAGFLSDADDRWEGYALADTARRSTVGCPAGGPFAGLAGAGGSYVLTLSRVPAPPPPPGTAIRLLRRSEVRLYLASDSRWYIGLRDCGSCPAQPIIGPLQPLAPRAATGARGSGLLLTYFDSLGERIPDAAGRADLARIEVVARAAGRAPLDGAGTRRGDVVRDSIHFTIGLRNRR